ncbi:MAG TPA: hypothetical protein VKU41_08020, partial [Polyangiaceae bacterium]|nr:hypothetical protein [Polyangiaceae bacterium]
GRYPLSNALLFSPADPNFIFFRGTYGMGVSHDNGKSWQFLCEENIGLPADYSPQDPSIALTMSAVVAGNFAPITGLNVSTDQGCNWSCVQGDLLDQPVADVTVRPDAPHTVLAVVSAAIDGGTGVVTQVYQSTDDGATWAPLGQRVDPTMAWTINSLEVSKSDPNRIYVTAWKGFVSTSRTVALFVSTDMGQTWTPRDIPSTMFDNTQEQYVWLGGVDPTDADRVYLRSNVDPGVGGTSKLYVTANAGQSFAVAKSFDLAETSMTLTLGEILGFALSPDGSKIYLGSSQGGLYVADRATPTIFEQTSPINIHCLSTRPAPGGGTELWICGDAPTSVHVGPQFTVGVSTDDGAHIQPLMRSNSDFCGAAACTAGTTFGCHSQVNGSQCPATYAGWCDQNNDVLFPCNTCHPDPGHPASGSCSCSTVGSGKISAGAAALGLAVCGLVGARWQSRRKRRRP